jgi:c-di-AMP phosphodiesterase-like protein
LLSFCMKKVALIRAINIIGAILFVIYGLIVHSYSVWILNAILTVINVIFLINYFLKEKRDKNI